MNVHQTSTIMSTNDTNTVIWLEQEATAAEKAGARPETIQAIKERLQQARSKEAEEEKYQDIKHIKRWSNHYLLKRYDEAVKQGEELFETNNAEGFEAILKLIEQIEDEGGERGIYPFISDGQFEYKIIWALGELTIIEGFVPARRLAEKMNYPTDRIKPILEQLYSSGKILRYSDEDDLWAVSVATRERLGIVKPTK